MAHFSQFSRVDIAELKMQILKKIGRQKAEKYFYYIKRFLALRITKLDFDKLCRGTIGKENIPLHNAFIRSILSNAFLGVAPLSKQAATVQSGTSTMQSGQLGEVLLQSCCKVGSVASEDRQPKIGDRPSLPRAVNNYFDFQRSSEVPSARELRLAGNKALQEVVSVEDGEEVDQIRCSPCIQSRSPVRAPLEISKNIAALRQKAICRSLKTVLVARASLCYNSQQLPDSKSLGAHLSQKIAAESSLNMSSDCANLLNNGMDVLLRRLIKPCVELAKARSSSRQVSRTVGNGAVNTTGFTSDPRYQVSLLDFSVAMESNPRLPRAELAALLEKITVLLGECRHRQ